MNISATTLTASAALPVLMAVCLILISRRHGKMITFCCVFLLGGLASFVLTRILNQALIPMEELVAGPPGSIRAAVASAFITAALAEELSRFLTSICVIRAFRNFVREESILTCGMIGLGFAMFENALSALTLSNAIDVIVQRTIPTMSHGATAVIMGSYLQRATKADRRSAARSLLLALLIPLMLHGLYDVGAFIVEFTEFPNVPSEPSTSDMVALGLAMAIMLFGLFVLFVELTWASRIVVGLRRTAVLQEPPADNSSSSD